MSIIQCGRNWLVIKFVNGKAYKSPLFRSKLAAQRWAEKRAQR